MKSQKVKNPQGYPWIITDLPEAEVPFKGVKAWILQGEKHQLVFFEMETRTTVPEHSHDYPQWGALIKGKMRLTIDGKTHIINKGRIRNPSKSKTLCNLLYKTQSNGLFLGKSQI